MNRIIGTLVMQLLLLNLIGCDKLFKDDDEVIVPPSTGGSAPGEIQEQASADIFSMQVLSANLQPLVGQHYEGWLIIDGAPVSTGRYNMTSEGGVVNVNSQGSIIDVNSATSSALFQLSFDPSSATAFVLTIEPNGDASVNPSGTHVVAGEFSNDLAVAEIGHPAAIGDDFATASGSFILATPSNGPTTHNQGIWWLTITGSGPAPALTLPELPEGWRYEGWVVNASTGAVNSTGVFATATGEDSDGAGGARAGLGTFPPFPGQDLINPPVVLNDGNHYGVITVEPYPDTDPNPFSLKIIKAGIEDGAAVQTDILATTSRGDDFPVLVISLR